MNRVDALAQLQEQLRALTFPFEVENAQAAQTLARRRAQQLEDLIIPRAQQLDAPLLCVVGGSTGAGKSTLVNSLLGEGVVQTSAIRPTTRTPTLIYRAEDAPWFESTRVLPSFTRVRGSGAGESAGENALRLQVNDRVPRGLALLDAPDLDSFVDRNRALAVQLFDAADLWIFVTTAARYADAVPWEVLREAHARSVALSIVLNRVPPGATNVVRGDFARLLADAGLSDAPLICVNEMPLQHDRLDPASVRTVKNWLSSLSDTAHTRAQVAKRALEGTVAELFTDVEHLLQVLSRQTLVRTDAASVVDENQRVALRRLEQATQNGKLLRGEVLSRWQAMLGVADISAGIDRIVTRVKSRVSGFFTGRNARADEVKEILGSNLSTIICDELARAVQHARTTWRANPAMRPFEAQVVPLSQEKLQHEARAAVKNWERAVVDLIKRQGANKKTSARMLAFGVNLLGLALIIVLFASTGGLTGAEVTVAGATGIVAQRVLEAVFGDAAVAAMTQRAHGALKTQMSRALERAMEPLTDALPDLVSSSEIQQALARARREWTEG